MGRRESPSRTQQAASPITWTILDLQRQQRCQATARPPRGAPGPEITAGGAGLAPSARGELDFSPGIGGGMRDQRPAGMSLCVPATSATRGDIPAAPGALVGVGGHTRGHKAPAPPPPGAPSRPSAPLRRLGGFLKQLGAAISGEVGRSHGWQGHNRGLAPATITQVPPQPSPGAHHHHSTPTTTITWHRHRPVPTTITQNGHNHHPAPTATIPKFPPPPSPSAHHSHHPVPTTTIAHPLGAKLAEQRQQGHNQHPQTPNPEVPPRGRRA